jgi:Tfp pilus assembly protein PilF
MPSKFSRSPSSASQFPKLWQNGRVLSHKLRLRFSFATLLVIPIAAGVTRPAHAFQAQSQQPASSDPSELAAEAQSALRAGDDARAISVLEKLAKLQPEVAEVHANLGTAYYFSGRYGDAAREYQRALKLKPALTNAHFLLGASLAQNGECRDAMPYLEKDLARVPDPALKHTLGTEAIRCDLALGHADKAVDLTRTLNRAFPNDPELLYLTSHLYSGLANQAAEDLLQSAPGSTEAHEMSAEVLAMQGKPADAVVEYRKALALNPNLPGVHYQIGRLLLEDMQGASKPDEARSEFQQELKIDSGNASAEYELGDMALQARQWDEAIEHFRRAAGIDPGFAEARIGLGKTLVSAGRPQEALAPLEEAIKLQPGNPNAHYQLSFAYRHLGRGAEADKELAVYREAHEREANANLAVRKGIAGDISGQGATPPQ